MEKNQKRDSELPTNTPSIVSPQDWEAARAETPGEGEDDDARP